MAVELRSAKTILLNRVKTWPDLLALLPNGRDSIYPNVTDFGPSTQAPYVVLAGDDEVLIDEIVTAVSFTFWVYDAPEKSYWTIERIHRCIRKNMEDLELGPTADGVLDPFSFEMKSGEGRDDNLNKFFKFARYRSWLVR